LTGKSPSDSEEPGDSGCRPCSGKSKIGVDVLWRWVTGVDGTKIELTKLINKFKNEKKHTCNRPCFCGWASHICFPLSFLISFCSLVGRHFYQNKLLDNFLKVEYEI